MQLYFPVALLPWQLFRLFAADTIVSIVMLAVPFCVVPFVIDGHQYIHLHGVCASLSDVNAGANCFPVQFAAAVAVLMFMHVVSTARVHLVVVSHV